MVQFITRFVDFYDSGEKYGNFLFFSISKKCGQPFDNKIYTYPEFKKIIFRNFTNLINCTIISLQHNMNEKIYVGDDYFISDDYNIVNYYSINSFLEKCDDLVYALINNSYKNIAFFPENIKNDEKIAIYAVTKDYNAYKFISSDLQKNKKIAKIALENAQQKNEYPKFALMLDDDLCKDYDFCKLILVGELGAPLNP